jgi:hypothetical protein
MQETLTVIRLGIKDKLKRTLKSTNPAESMIDCVRTTQRNVKNWSSAEIGLRWTAAGILEAEKQFPKVIGYPQLPQLAVAIQPTSPSPAQPRHEPGGRDHNHHVTITPGSPSPKFYGERGNLWRLLLAGRCGTEAGVRLGRRRLLSGKAWQAGASREVNVPVEEKVPLVVLLVRVAPLSCWLTGLRQRPAARGAAASFPGLPPPYRDGETAAIGARGF